MSSWYTGPDPYGIADWKPPSSEPAVTQKDTTVLSGLVGATQSLFGWLTQREHAKTAAMYAQMSPAAQPAKTNTTLLVAGAGIAAAAGIYFMTR